MIEPTDVFEVFEKHRGDAIVLAGGLSGYKHWHEYSTNEKRDVGNFVGTMGALTSAALGVALAQPEEKVVLFDSEGSLLMNLGSLATTADQRPRNFYHFPAGQRELRHHRGPARSQRKGHRLRRPCQRRGGTSPPTRSTTWRTSRAAFRTFSVRRVPSSWP